MCVFFVFCFLFLKKQTQIIKTNESLFVWMQKKLLRLGEDLLHHGARTDPVAKWTQFTPLHTAAYFDNASLITLLLTKARPNVTAKCAQFEGATPLHLAAMAGNLAAATALLRHGAPADAKDDHLRTPLDCAKLTATSQQQQLDGAADETSEEREFRLSFTPIINLVKHARF